MKRLAVFLDGTWNEPGDNTNVWRLRAMLASADDSENQQLSYYDRGVGTSWYDRFRGGALGFGLSQNIREAYQWLIENYDDGDEIYIFGFSRGAFTARSLAGMIAKCGLLVPGAPMPVLQVFERYESNDARPIYRLPRSAENRSDLSLEERWLVQYSRRVRIKFIGVWDTVGALGWNILPSRLNERGEFNQHFVRLSNNFDNCYQAMAIDENRKAYPLSRWYHFIPEKAPNKVHVQPPRVEQRWFVGAHSNVGGGYRSDPLAQIPLHWMQQMAIRSKLRFRRTIPLGDNEHLAKPVDSFKKFLKGFYRAVRFGKRFYRSIGVDREAVTGGWIEPHFETIDGSVFDKWRDDPSYRPNNIVDWAQQKNVDPESLRGTQNAR